MKGKKVQTGSKNKSKKHVGIWCSKNKIKIRLKDYRNKYERKEKEDEELGEVKSEWKARKVTKKKRKWK